MTPGTAEFIGLACGLALVLTSVSLFHLIWQAGDLFRAKALRERAEALQMLPGNRNPHPPSARQPAPSTPAPPPRKL